MSDKKIFDDMARVAGSAVGTMAGIKGEVESFVRQRLEACLAGMNLVSREEFDLVKDIVVKARMEQERLIGRIDELEKKHTITIGSDNAE